MYNAAVAKIETVTPHDLSRKKIILAVESALQFLQQPWLNAYDEAGNKKSNVLLFEKMANIKYQTFFVISQIFDLLH